MDLDELAQLVARLEALEDIRRVAHGYCVGADHRDEARWLDAWTRDAVWQVSPDCTMTGHDEILAGVQMQWAHFRQMQHGTVNHTIDIAHDDAADDAARGRGRLVRAARGFLFADLRDYDATPHPAARSGPAVVVGYGAATLSQLDRAVATLATS